MENIRNIVMRFKPYARHLAALGVAVVLGLGAGILTVSSMPPAADSADRWTLPRWSLFKAGARRAEIAQLSLWVQDPTRKAQATIAQPDVPPWRFIGIVQEGTQRKAVIELEKGKKLQRLSAGEGLPNGAKITVVGARELTYLEGETEKTLTLFAPDKKASSPSDNKSKQK